MERVTDIGVAAIAKARVLLEYGDHQIRFQSMPITSAALQLYG